MAQRTLLLDTPDALVRLLGAYAVSVGSIDLTQQPASVALPLLSSGAVQGVLWFGFAHPRQVSDDEQIFLAALASQCALAVERAALYERERRTAETLQMSLLPRKLPEVPGIVLQAEVCAGAGQDGNGGRLVRRLPPARRARRSCHRRRHGQRTYSGGSNEPHPKRAARATPCPIRALSRARWP